MNTTNRCSTSFKGYRKRRNTYMFDFPNDEVQAGFLTLVAADYFGTNERTASWTQELLDSMDDGDTLRMQKLFTSFLASIPYSLRRRGSEPEREKHFQYTFYLIMRMVSAYTIYAEKEQSEGRVDCIVETSAHVYIFEFKRDGSAAEALQQIRQRGYAREYVADIRRIHLIGVNFSTETGTVDGWEEA